MHKTSILYAEDDQVTRENYALVLKHYFSKVYEAKDGKEAMDLYYREKPDALVLDISMPHIDGLEMVETIRRKNKLIPILILTAHSDKDKLLKAIPLGLTAYLVKPMKGNDFTEAIRKILGELDTDKRILLAGTFVYDKEHQELFYRNKLVKLSKMEKSLLSLLADQAGHFITQDLLLSEIWFNEAFNESHTSKLTQLIYRLHTKLSEVRGKKTVIIENSYSFGYRLII